MTTSPTLSSVDRALRLVEFLARAERGWSLAEISSGLGITKATAHRTLATLRGRQWVEQDATTGEYRLGDGIWPIAAYYSGVRRLADALHPALAAISQSCNELTHLGMLTGRNIVYLDKVEPDRAIRVVSRIGRETPAATTALGRALVAARLQDPHDSVPTISWYAEAYASDGEAAVNRAREGLRVGVSHALQYGWAQECEENEQGITCVAVALSVDDVPRLAISVTAPSDRLPKTRRYTIATIIAGAVSQIDAGPTVRPSSELRNLR